MILIAGDSFTAETKFPIWHDHLIKHSQKKLNVARHGVGNIFIADTIKTVLDHNRIKACLVIWSDMDRLDKVESKVKAKMYTGSSGKIWNHYGNMVSGEAKADWKSLGYDNVVAMNEKAIDDTHNLIEQLKIPYVYSFINDSDLIPERLKVDAVKPFIGDYAVEKQMLEDDNYHANAEAHKKWSDLVRTKIEIMEIIS
jgi:hypothetical protein